MITEMPAAMYIQLSCFIGRLEMLLRTRNFRKVDGITIAQPHPWSSAAHRVIQGFKSLKPFMQKLGNYLDIVSDSSLPMEAGVKSHIGRQKSRPYYVGYYENTTAGPPSLSDTAEKSHIRRKKSVSYYEDYYIKPESDPLSFEGERREIERQWKGEIERYIKMGGKKERFVDFISAAKTGFPDERDEEANDKVRLFREDFVHKASRDDIAHVIELHEKIRSKLEQSKRNSLAKGDERTYQECSGRIARLDRGKRQLQFVLRRKSKRFVLGPERSAEPYFKRALRR